MKALLIAILASAFLMSPAVAQEGQLPMCAETQESWYLQCGYNETYRITTYYEYPEGPECGSTHQFCWGDTNYYHEGCYTSYYSVWYNDCQCN